jgi:release factor glutamine methyltransferase
MRKRLKPIFDRVVKPAAKWYFSKPRNYSFKDIKGKVLPDVFHPQLTISTKLLMEFLETQELKNKSLLELGCGTGFISVFAAKKGANVLATDINPKALENAKLNAELNSVELEVAYSDLFENVNQKFDYIIINPPYYPKQPNNEAEQAWYCGEKFEYFTKLFADLGNYFYSNSKVFMILSEDCQIEHIKSLARVNGITFQIELQTRRQKEENYIFSLKKL